MDCNASNLTAIFDKNESYLLIGVQGSLKQGKFIFLCDTMRCLAIIAGVSLKAAKLFCISGEIAAYFLLALLLPFVILITVFNTIPIMLVWRTCNWIN